MRAIYVGAIWCSSGCKSKLVLTEASWAEERDRVQSVLASPEIKKGQF